MGKVQFIVMSHPRDAGSTKSSKLVRSHAARAAHARSRQARTIEYQAGKAVKVLSRDGAETPNQQDQVVSEPGQKAGELVPRAVLPSPVGLLSSDRRDPFGTFSGYMGTREQFLFDHYVTSVIPYLNANCNDYMSPKAFMETMPREWLRLAVTDVGFMQGIFLAACRHLSENLQPCTNTGPQQQYYVHLATKYKVSCVQAVIKAIAPNSSTNQISDTTLAQVLVLALDEIWLGDYAMSQRHVLGAIKMVELKGGAETLGLNGLLAKMLYQFVVDSQKMSSVEKIEKPCKRVAVQLCLFQEALSQSRI